MTPTKYQKYVFGLKSGHLKIGANGAGAYTIPRSVSYTSLYEKVEKFNIQPLQGSNLYCFVVKSIFSVGQFDPI